MPRYGKAAQDSVERTMRKRKHGTLKSGRSGKQVKSREQAIAIGLEEAREKGAKVPARGSSSRRKSAGHSTSSHRTTSSRGTSRRSTSRSTSRSRMGGSKRARSSSSRRAQQT